jgi:GT2 family glycosyltransferase
MSTGPTAATAPGAGPLDAVVVIPCRDGEDHIGEQLDALVAQRWDGRWGIVVADNGSTDATVDIVRTYVDRGLVSLVDASSRPGAAHARNAAVRATAATGSSALLFCDADDVAAPGWVAAMAGALRHHRIVAGALDVDTLNPPSLAASRPRGSLRDAPRFAGTPFMRTNNGGIRRDLFDALGGFDEEFPGLEDIEISLRATAAGEEVAFVPDALIRYRYRPDARSLWRQGSYYGWSQTLLAVRARELGLPRPGRLAGLRSWAWLVVHLPGTLQPSRRLAWLWVLAFRFGTQRASWARRLRHA